MTFVDALFVIVFIVQVRSRTSQESDMRRRLSHGYTQLTNAVWTGKDRRWVEGLSDPVWSKNSAGQ